MIKPEFDILIETNISMIYIILLHIVRGDVVVV